MMAAPDPLARPTLPAHPVQADLGSQVYYMVCMACHGEQGQGLTPEWVESWDLGEQTCWSSKCHAANHPPEGFVLPKYIPPVVGSVVTARFATVLDLHDYVKKNMPWQAPGSLTDEEYWQLTAYLARWNGVDPGAQALDPQLAASLRFQPLPSQPEAAPEQAAPQQEGKPVIWLVAGAFGSIFLLFLLVKFRRNT
jgi:cytochrome c